jgi:hypothetical protein
MYQGGDLDKCIQVAAEFIGDRLVYPDSMMPEQIEALRYDAAHLVTAFLYGFHHTYLPEMSSRYDFVEVEEEINWLVSELDQPIGDRDLIVMMSRTDGIHRDGDGELWNTSHKTAKTLYDVDQFVTDIQRFSECLAVWAKYGKPPKGTLYNYFLKGKKYKDPDLLVDRFSSGLIHPYINRQVVGDVTPEMLNFSYEWQELVGHQLKSRHVGKGWERCSIYNEMDFEEYLEWIRDQIVPRNKDYFKDSILGMMEHPFNEYHAMRWLDGLRNKEEWFAGEIDFMASVQEIFPDHDRLLNFHVPLETSQCKSYNRPCDYYKHCWENVDLDMLDLVPRVANHLQEIYE